MPGITGKYIYDKDGNVIGATGGKKAALTNKLKNGEDFYAKIGRRGGQNGNTGGFASDVVGSDGLTGAERARIAGKKGGKISKRKSNKNS